MIRCTLFSSKSTLPFPRSLLSLICHGIIYRTLSHLFKLRLSKDAGLTLIGERPALSCETSVRLMRISIAAIEFNVLIWYFFKMQEHHVRSICFLQVDMPIMCNSDAESEPPTIIGHFQRCILSQDRICLHEQHSDDSLCELQ